ncbi:MAG: hypothetical protein RBR41_01105 [Desulfovibrio sp.]|uniref:hypothetical protein n=1 Tax=Desulfovibrio sp. TaxID=885 RepID=UPI002A359AA8|nr:hypothetical protein [Desulfovibrio sp.]MDY0258250.1 hypothetical protein [Desulfovibrio sp.]
MFARNCGEPQLPLPLPPASLPFCLQRIPFLIKAKKEQERGCDDLQDHDLPVHKPPQGTGNRAAKEEAHGSIRPTHIEIEEAGDLSAHNHTMHICQAKWKMMISRKKKISSPLCNF